MPFYEYECSACKFYVEALQKISDPPIKKCPSCKKPTMKRLISVPVFRLKGSGWYETDFKSDQDKKRNLAGEDKDTSSADTKSETAAEKSADVKPAVETKADSKAGTPDSKVEKSSRGKSSASTNPKTSASPKKSAAKPKSKPKPAAKKK